MSFKYPIISNHENFIIWKVWVHSRLVTKDFPNNILSIVNADIAFHDAIFKANPALSNATAVSYIFNALDKNQLRKVKDYITLVQIIRILDAEYESKTSVQLYFLIAFLFLFKMSDDQDIHSYVLDFEQLFSRLKLLKMDFSPKH